MGYASTIFHKSSATSARQQGKGHSAVFWGIRVVSRSQKNTTGRFADEARIGNTIRVVGTDVCDVFNPTLDNDCNSFL